MFKPIDYDYQNRYDTNKLGSSLKENSKYQKKNKYVRCMTPIIIKTQSSKFSNKNLMAQSTFNKKSISNLMPKYQTKISSVLEKQNILFEIQKQNQKLIKQRGIHFNLQKKLQKKKNKLQRQTYSLKKFNNYKESNFDGIQRKITIKKPYLLQLKDQNILKSIYIQIQQLTLQSKQNQQAILKLKQSKKYTRFIENQQQKQTFLTQLKSMKRYLKRLKIQISRLKRISHQAKLRKMQQIIMQGKMQDGIENQNIRIYREIQQKNLWIKQAQMKKITLDKKKYLLIQEIEQMKIKYNVEDQMLDQVYWGNNKVGSKGNSLVKGNCESQSLSEQSNKKWISSTNKTTGLTCLQEQQDEQEQSGENYPQPSKNNRDSSKKDTIKQTAVQTVKIHSRVSSSNGDFYGVQFENGSYGDNLQISANQKQKQQTRKSKIQKLENKYFYQDYNIESQQFQQEQDEDNGQFYSENAQQAYEQSDQEYDSVNDSNPNKFNNNKITTNQSNINKLVIIENFNKKPKPKQQTILQQKKLFKQQQQHQQLVQRNSRIVSV